jgi:predicted nucleic acid-binding protein
VASPVLDSSALLVFLFKEKGHQKIVDVFDRATESDEAALIAAPNWAEVRYIVQRKVGLERWSEVRSTILALPLEVVAVDQALAESAGALKAAKRMSLADCFAAALAADGGCAVHRRSRVQGFSERRRSRMAVTIEPPARAGGTRPTGPRSGTRGSSRHGSSRWSAPAARLGNWPRSSSRR